MTDKWTELERLAKAATPEWNIGTVTHSDGRTWGWSASGPTHSIPHSPTTEQRNAAYGNAQKDRDWLKACDPKTILTLIALARSEAVLRDGVLGYLKDNGGSEHCGCGTDNGQDSAEVTCQLHKALAESDRLRSAAKIREGK